ncbi:hypothetical protein FB45DRAFT_873647 [Roridomyces roridus]|uniref:Uncharacterized protein n=1 Tax=Roridomyces roridus TaxID=1738132 RepID=A0AAD7B9G9_9AGAR|nr:hypothetical protein FB45DRAFT_873647 [Roridomyces roridus]
MASPFYPVDPNGDSRVPLQVLGTDYIWRCPTWTFVRNWVAKGGTAHVGMLTTIASRRGRYDQDDIFVFGTALTTEMQARYKAFLASADPNEPGLDEWVPATATDVHIKQCGVLTTVDGEVPVLACDPSFWGQAAFRCASSICEMRTCLFRTHSVAIAFVRLGRASLQQ